MSDFFYRIGRFVGPSARKGRWIWQTLVGAEGDEISAEHAVGRDLAAAMEAEVGVDDDESANARLAAVADELTRRVANRRRSFRFTIASAAPPNAFALPGGFIFISRSLLELCEWNDDEIAFVLAHEMAHVIRKHAIDRIIQSSALSVITRAAPGPSGALGKWVRRAGSKILDGSYSQDNEFDADELGARLAIAAGFAYDGPERLLRRLARFAADPHDIENSQPNPSGADGETETSAGRKPRDTDSTAATFLRYVSSHPPFEDRIRRVRIVARDTR